MAFVDAQVNVDAAPLATLAGLAVSVTVGTGVCAAVPNTRDFVCQPSAPPTLTLQARTSPPPTAPKHTPTSPESAINPFVVQPPAVHIETSRRPATPLGQVSILVVLVIAD